MDDKLPPPIQVTQVEKYSEKVDPPMVDLKITNPVAYFKKWVGKFLKNQDIDFHLRIKPFATIGLVLAFGVVGTTTFSIGRYLFPYSSPIFHREVMYQGNLQTGEQGLYLTLPNSDLYTLKPKSDSLLNFKNLTNGPVLVKGNLTAEKFVIEVSEIIPLTSSNTQIPQTNLPVVSAAPSLPDSPDPTPSSAGLPDLYSNLQWETTQKRILIFTSGKRKIEQEGVYLESAQLAAFPQDFINYYIQEFKNKGFKETFNSINPDGITITYAKDDLFLTFGTKNKYSGSGDKKQLAGYTAFIEHN